MAKARNGKRESFVMRYDWLGIADAVSPETALWLFKILKEYFIDWEIKWEYNESVLATFQQRKRAREKDDEEYKVSVIMWTIWWLKRLYKDSRKEKAESRLTEIGCSKDEIALYIRMVENWNTSL